MRKPIFHIFVALFLVPLCANAQVFDDERFAAPPRVEGGHSLSIGLVGLQYSYEHPIGRKATIIVRAGADFGVAWGGWRTGTGIGWAGSSYSYWMVVPVLEIEPRWYYGLDRRDIHARSTEGNAGSFLSLKIRNVFPGYISDPYLRTIGSTTFTPAWGLRRMWGGHWLFEFAAGFKIGITHYGEWWGGERAIDHIDLNLRFGYSF